MSTSVVHLMPFLMERQLDQNAAYLLQKAIEEAWHRRLHKREHRCSPRL